MKPTKQLVARRTVISKEDLPLAQAAGGTVTIVHGKASKRKRYFVSKIIASAILVAKKAAARTGRRPIDVLRALDQANAVDRAAVMVQESDQYPTDHVNAVLAQILAVPVVMGPIRANPDGTFHIFYGSEWVPASNDLLREWDASRRLTGPGWGPMHYAAASTILRWKEGEK